MTSLSAAVGRAQRDWDGPQFRVIFVICLPACLCAGAARRMTPAFWRGGAQRRPLLVEAWDTAGSTARLALAG